MIGPVDVSRYDSETRAKDAAWEALVDGFVVTVKAEGGKFVVRMYTEGTTGGGE